MADRGRAARSCMKCLSRDIMVIISGLHVPSSGWPQEKQVKSWRTSLMKLMLCKAEAQCAWYSSKNSDLVLYVSLSHYW